MSMVINCRTTNIDRNFTFFNWLKFFFLFVNVLNSLITSSSNKKAHDKDDPPYHSFSLLTQVKRSFFQKDSDGCILEPPTRCFHHFILAVSFLFYSFSSIIYFTISNYRLFFKTNAVLISLYHLIF